MTQLSTLLTPAQSLTANQAAQARANIWVTKKNYIINGGGQVSQENGNTAVTSGYPVDQFALNVLGTSGTFTGQQVSSPTPGGSPNRFRFTVTAADAAVAASDIVYINTKLEGARVVDLRMGTSSAKALTLQFGVKAPAGTYCVVLLNSLNNRSYVGEYVIAAGEANTDVVKSISLNGDTSGTWATDNTAGIEIRWGLMCGSTYQQTAGTWSTGNVVGSSNQFNLMGTLSNVFELFDVGLYEGATAPPFQLPDYASELALCKRYWRSSYPIGTQPGNTTTTGEIFRFPDATTSFMSVAYVQFNPDMRATPTVTIYAPQSGTSGKVRNQDTGTDVAAASNQTSTTGTHIYVNSVSVVQSSSIGAHYKADARM